MENTYFSVQSVFIHYIVPWWGKLGSFVQRHLCHKVAEKEGKRITPKKFDQRL